MSSVIPIDDDIVLTPEFGFNLECTVLIDENDKGCTCKLLISANVLDTNGNLLLDEEKDGIGVTLDEATSLQIDGNRFTPYMKREAVHATLYLICL